jgi:hypothetical protein
VRSPVPLGTIYPQQLWSRYTVFRKPDVVERIDMGDAFRTLLKALRIYLEMRQFGCASNPGNYLSKGDIMAHFVGPPFQLLRLRLLGSAYVRVRRRILTVGSSGPAMQTNPISRSIRSAAS